MWEHCCLSERLSQVGALLSREARAHILGTLVRGEGRIYGEVPARQHPDMARQPSSPPVSQRAEQAPRVSDMARQPRQAGGLLGKTPSPTRMYALANTHVWRGACWGRVMASPSLLVSVSNQGVSESLTAAVFLPLERHACVLDVIGLCLFASGAFASRAATLLPPVIF